MSIRRITFAKAGMAALALSFIMMTALAGCDTDGGDDGGGVPADLIGKMEGSGTGTGGQYIEFTSDEKLLIRVSASGSPTATYTVTSVSGGTVEIQSANATISDGSFDYTLNTAKTELTVSGQVGNGNSVGYAKYTKPVAGGDNGVTVSPATATVAKGATEQFTASPAGVTWSIVETNKKAGTTITGGLLTVASDEALTTLTVKAALTTDATKFGTAAVTVGSGTGPSAPTWTAVPAGDGTANTLGTGNNPFSSGNNIRGIVYGNSKFFAVGDRGKIAYSTDGATWTGIAGADSKFGIIDLESGIRGIAYGGATGSERFVAVGACGKISYSGDSTGTSWTLIPGGTGSGKSTFPDSIEINGIAYGAGKFVAVSSNGQAAHSTDGTSWASISMGSFTSISAIAYVNNQFVAVGVKTGAGQQGVIATSSNGTEWTYVNDSILIGPNNGFNGIAYGASKLVAVGQIGKITYSNAAGTTWTRVENSPFDTTAISGIAWSGDKFVAVGQSGKMAYSADGVTWTAITGTDNTFGTTAISRITYGGGKFVAVGNSGRMTYSN